MAMVEISIVPLGTKTTSLSKYVAQAVKILQDEKDIKYELTAMGTIIDGKLEQLLSVAQRMHQAVFDAGAMRVLTTIKIDDRRDKSSSISSKVGSVQRELGA
ncbi:MTH1187 family thiamine-binding protein [Chloroflexota bacterium]